MKLQIVQVGDPVLRQRSRPLTPEEIRSDAIQKLIADMRETMQNAPGVGLAGPQVGRPLQLAVIEDCEEWLEDVAADDLAERERKPVPFHVIINPKISESSGGQVEFFEGCLSLPGFSAVVARARRVRVECLNERGQQRIIKAAGWYARILQHEIDHLLGKIYIDRMRSRTFSSTENFDRFWSGKRIEDVRARLDSTNTSTNK